MTIFVARQPILDRSRDLALAYERGDWADVSRLADVVGVATDRLPPRYREAVAFGNAALAAA